PASLVIVPLQTAVTAPVASAHSVGVGDADYLVAARSHGAESRDLQRAADHGTGRRTRRERDRDLAGGAWRQPERRVRRRRVDGLLPDVTGARGHRAIEDARLGDERKVGSGGRRPPPPPRGWGPPPAAGGPQRPA